MLSAAFIFEEGDLDDDFFALDDKIAQAAEATDGFMGKQNWLSPDGKTKNSTYYWRDDEALKTFSSHPLHLEAKRQYERWYKGFHVVIARIEKTYGDGGLDMFLPDSRAKFRK